MSGERRSSVRRAAVPAAVSSACLVVLGLLGTRARTGEAYAWEARLQDAAADRAVQFDEFSDVGDDVLGYFLVYGADAVGAAAVVATTLLLVAAGRARAAIVAFAALAVGLTLVLVLKGVFDRPAGPYEKYELPSGHAARSVLAPGVLLLVVWSTRWRWAVITVGAVFAATVATAVVYEDWHLASDVFAGWTVAVAVLAAAAAALGGEKATTTPAHVGEDAATARSTG